MMNRQRHARAIDLHTAQMFYRRLLAEALADGDAWLAGGVARAARSSVLIGRDGRLIYAEGANL